MALAIIAMTAAAGGRGNVFSRTNKGQKTERTAAVNSQRNKADAVFESVKQQYEQGKISADSVVSLALYHKVWSPELAERCLQLVMRNGNPRTMAELGVLYAFSPEFSGRASEGVRLLQESAKAGYNDANAYLGFYYYTQKDYKKAKTYFDACREIKYGFADAAIGGMYIEGKGVKEDPVKAREYYRQSALKGYPRGMTLYGFNLRATGGGPVNYPDAFYWLYMAGDLGEDAARTALFLPRRKGNVGETDTEKDAAMALQWIEMAQAGKNIKNEPIYKDGFLAGLKDRERAAEQGDDWARFYLGSMNYNGDFLNRNYDQVLRYYIPISQNAKLPAPVLALVNERLARIYTEGKVVKADRAKAEHYMREAARHGNLTAYKTVEGISE